MKPSSFMDADGDAARDADGDVDGNAVGDAAGGVSVRKCWSLLESCPQLWVCEPSPPPPASTKHTYIHQLLKFSFFCTNRVLVLNGRARSV